MEAQRHDLTEVTSPGERGLGSTLSPQATTRVALTALTCSES